MCEHKLPLGSGCFIYMTEQTGLMHLCYNCPGSLCGQYIQSNCGLNFSCAIMVLNIVGITLEGKKITLMSFLSEGSLRLYFSALVTPLQ